MAPDFSGYATKAGLKCSDGRTIMPDAFKAQDGMRVPLVWKHGHTDPANVLGHAILENRPDGVYCYGFFNDTASGKNAKQLVEHKDVDRLSIYANQLMERAKDVFHGTIKEVSLVLFGANPGAVIDQVTVQHSDGIEEILDDAAVIYTGIPLEHEDMPEKKVDDKPTEDKQVEHAASDATVQDVYDTLDDDQKQLFHFMIGAAVDEATAAHSDTSTDSTDSKDKPDTDKPDSDEGDLEHKEGSDMARNVFEQNGKGAPKPAELTLSHDDVKEIVDSAWKVGSLKEAVEEYALKHGIENLDLLFPDAQNVDNTPEFDKRRTEWVAGVLSGTRHAPYSRIRTMSADLTFEDARAKGYVKGTLKKEEFFGLAKRVTTPTTIYKKQKLDRDDIIDITTMDVVSWLKGEMRMMLEEEVARAILIGDGRAVDDEDKIQDGSNSGIGIRPIANEDELYASTIYVNIDDANSSMSEVVDAILSSRYLYKGTGTPTFYTTESTLTKLLLQKDTLGRRLYRNVDELASELRVAAIVSVEVMEDVDDLVGIIVNLTDYIVGTDRGGEVSMFDDFDIDYNQYKYLIETRLSGALVKIKAAIIVRKVAGTNVTLAEPTEPGFVSDTGVITIPTVTHVTYKNGAGATLAAGAQTALVAGASLHVKAFAAAGYNFPDNANDEWTFTRDA